MADRRPRRIRLTPDRRATIVAGLQRHFDAEYDEPLSAFRAEALVDFFLERLGPAVYNQGVHDAAAYVQDKLADIEGDLHEPLHD